MWVSHNNETSLTWKPQKRASLSARNCFDVGDNRMRIIRIDAELRHWRTQTRSIRFLACHQEMRELFVAIARRSAGDLGRIGRPRNLPLELRQQLHRQRR